MNIYSNICFVQLPIKLCIAIPISKPQQTMKVSGIDNTGSWFTHDQFYVACSKFYTLAQKETYIISFPLNKKLIILFIEKFKKNQ